MGRFIMGWCFFNYWDLIFIWYSVFCLLEFLVYPVGLIIPRGLSRLGLPFKNSAADLFDGPVLVASGRCEELNIAKNKIRCRMLLSHFEPWQRKEDNLFRTGKSSLFPARLKQGSAKSGPDVLCYCLMPNHFHLILREVSEKRMGCGSFHATT